MHNLRGLAEFLVCESVFIIGMLRYIVRIVRDLSGGVIVYLWENARLRETGSPLEKETTAEKKSMKNLKT